MFLGACIEGESIVLFFSALSYKGYLDFPAVLAVAFTGTLLADQSLYYIGRYYGPKLLERKPHWKPKIERIFALLHRHELLFILSFRFVYGIRTLSPLVIGASGISAKRFSILNLTAATLWTLISCTTGYYLGYFFADAIEEFVEKVIQYQKIFILTIIVLIGVVVIVKKGWHKWQQAKGNNNNEKIDKTVQ